jgi:hypothetical protein
MTDDASPGGTVDDRPDHDPQARFEFLPADEG